jgi:glycosyltransferase involved in cell wall biosynthesis
MYPPHHYGGYELVWHSAVEHLRARGHEVRVLTTNTDTGARGPDPDYVFRDLRWPLRDAEFAPLSRRAKVALARHSHRVLDGHLAALQPDVVGWWSMGGLTLTMLESVRRRCLPAVAFVHDDWLDYGRWADGWLNFFRGRRTRFAPLAERMIGMPATVDFDRAAHYLFGSERTRRHALGHIDLGRTGVAQLGIHEAYLDPAPPKDWTWRLLYVGRLDPRKGIDTAVRALADLPDEAHLEMLGGWDMREEERLRRLTSDLGLESRVTFGGHRGRAEIATAYADSDVTIFPVRWEEPWGLVPLEAMGRGRPVVATGRGGSSEYLRDGVNCLLFEADSPESCAAALRRLASDPALRLSLRLEGLKTADQYTEAIYNCAVERALLEARALL